MFHVHYTKMGGRASWSYKIVDLTGSSESINQIGSNSWILHLQRVGLY